MFSKKSRNFTLTILLHVGICMYGARDKLGKFFRLHIFSSESERLASVLFNHIELMTLGSFWT